jgi:hypothetical protein
MSNKSLAELFNPSGPAHIMLPRETPEWKPVGKPNLSRKAYLLVPVEITITDYPESGYSEISDFQPPSKEMVEEVFHNWGEIGTLEEAIKCYYDMECGANCLRSY